MTLVEAYRVCRGIAKREAKNFYYAFRVLPPHKRDAMCAVYAFMRRADDLADDEAVSVVERRRLMEEWMVAWRASRQPGSTSQDAVFLALADTQQRFGISDALLEELVQGTSMDLAESGAGTGVLVGAGLQGYRTFDEVYQYCYLVASVVGLVCIRIFGYSDARAEELAEKTGIAFQLTNILRDVKEDAERGRLYLPMDLMGKFSVLPEDVIALTAGRGIRANEQGLLRELSTKAWEYYGAAKMLLPLIDADSRAALWVLVEIYSGLLKRVDARNGDVFSQRARVPTMVKLAILGRGIEKSLVNRVMG
ncbi:phytoene/squalene synthase family protein [Granulicella arctica]|uniref:phytoene/squalene synthase family protein n=1 Tax=Granulicella arctica TaxID=940613 RepID=UPI0021E08B49|nr:phytoene/squalene synthase family protein [Granulicella arctica]